MEIANQIGIIKSPLKQEGAIYQFESFFFNSKKLIFSSQSLQQHIIISGNLKIVIQKSMYFRSYPQLSQKFAYGNGFKLNYKLLFRNVVHKLVSRTSWYFIPLNIDIIIFLDRWDGCYILRWNTKNEFNLGKGKH